MSRGRQVHLPSGGRGCRNCREPYIGQWQFHVLTNALRTARNLNIEAGGKLYCVVIRSGHFTVVLDD